ncbi:uncharacterized protein PAC_01286 [Phialocephala subalpina]|uniref:F-box domain-containing protein n=1 Tax=Phialocephala subalpina TaxID=576137 RepID=A0A1L7WF65_9HELO|nr:uncharacterized protein PAC_01286 [Phialocephala subalpina]
MESLSTELVTNIVHFCELPELMNLRQSCKAFYAPATRQIFSHIHVTPEPDSLGDVGDDSDENTKSEDFYKNFNSILSSSQLSSEVTSIKITTSNDPNKDKQDYNNDEEESILTEGFEEVIRSISKFPNLRDVAVEFACVCMLDDDPDDWWKMKAEESAEFRYDVLRTLFSALNETPKLRSLSLKHLQNYNDRRLITSPSFKPVLERLTELRLKIVTEYETSSPESSWDIPQMYTFFHEFPDLWLKPTQNNLTSLTLHADLYWGYMPLCDFRSLHFPKLKKLELGNYAFTHDWQLDWILSHDTLEELVLDDAVITNYIYGYGPLDNENYPLEPIGGSYDNAHFWEYPRSWSEYFSKIEQQLPNLKVFKFGNGNWDEGRNFDYGKWNAMGVEGALERYKGFDKGTGPSPWVELDEMIQEMENGRFEPQGWQGVGKNRMIESLDEDTAAYEKLMNTIKARAGKT